MGNLFVIVNLWFCSLSLSQALRFDLPEKWQFFFAWQMFDTSNEQFTEAVHELTPQLYIANWKIQPIIRTCSIWVPVVWGPRIGVPRSKNPFHFRGSQESKPPMNRGEGHLFFKKKTTRLLPRIHRPIPPIQLLRRCFWRVFWGINPIGRKHTSEYKKCKHYQWWGPTLKWQFFPELNTCFVFLLGDFINYFHVNKMPTSFFCWGCNTLTV